MMKEMSRPLLVIFMVIGFSCLNSPQVAHQSSSEATSDTKQSEPVSTLDVLKTALQERNRKIETVRLIDAKIPYPGAPRHVVVAWGIRKDFKFEGQFDDELFGLFVMDGSLTKIEQTLDIFATPRWFDYEVRIESSTIDEVTIAGKGGTYGDAVMRRRYKLGEAR
jgi:hypothetical protein